MGICAGGGVVPALKPHNAEQGRGALRSPASSPFPRPCCLLRTAQLASRRPALPPELPSTPYPPVPGEAMPGREAGCPVLRAQAAETGHAELHVPEPHRTDPFILLGWSDRDNRDNSEHMRGQWSRLGNTVAFLALPLAVWP